MAAAVSEMVVGSRRRFAQLPALEGGRNCKKTLYIPKIDMFQCWLGTEIFRVEQVGLGLHELRSNNNAGGGGSGTSTRCIFLAVMREVVVVTA